jgi:protein-S-isoprenylcysteine O-methyltransferase Ste14
MRRGTAFVVAQFTLFVLIAVAPRMRHSDWPLWVRVLGVALAVTGAVLTAWAIRALGPAMTAMPEPRPAVPVATRGPYGIVRHPMYSSLVVLFAGVSLARSTWLGLVLTGVLALLFDFKARFEERRLRDDAAYAAYAAATPRRFVPGLY